MKAIIIFLLLPLYTINFKTDSVYLCMGNYSKAYHQTKYCKGLRHCSTDLKKVSLYDATHKYHRKHCGYER